MSFKFNFFKIKIISNICVPKYTFQNALFQMERSFSIKWYLKILYEAVNHYY